MTNNIFAVIGCAALLISCGTTQPYRVPGTDESTATIRVYTESDRNHTVFAGLDQRLYIKAIDEKSTVNQLCIQNCAPTEAFVTPGRHNLDLMYAVGNTYANGSIYFDAELGKTYFVRRQTNGYGVRFWVEEVETKKVVGGIPGFEPKQ